MHDEDDFLQKLLENPADDTTRLVYADWLDERDDAESKTKAQFLRLTAQLPASKGESRITRKLQRLAAGLDTNWLAVVSRLKIEYCGSKRVEDELWRYHPQFNFVCDKRWDELTVTEDNAVRFCEGCKQNVYYCDTITEARNHAQEQHCVAVDLGIVRREDDLSPPVMMLGKPTAKFMRQERERLQVDEVSQARERQKSEKKGND
jgi:uncharacterized protein (TIGR02996 family)